MQRTLAEKIATTVRQREAVRFLGTDPVLGDDRVDRRSTSCLDGAQLSYGATLSGGLAACHPVLVGSRRKQVFRPTLRQQVVPRRCANARPMLPWHTHPLASSLAKSETPTAGSSSLSIVSSHKSRSIGKGRKIVTIEGCRRDRNGRRHEFIAVIQWRPTGPQRTYVVAIERFATQAPPQRQE